MIAEKEGMCVDELRKIYDEMTVRTMCNLCPGCGRDNMPTLFQALTGKAKWVCDCGCDRTPLDSGEE